MSRTGLEDAYIMRGSKKLRMGYTTGSCAAAAARGAAFMLLFGKEIQEVKNGEANAEDNVLINAPHPEYEIVNDHWEHSYTREKAAYPIESVRENKFWVNVARVDNTLGDRKLLPTRYGSFS